MRDYARVSPHFWVKGSGKRLRGDIDAQLLALYLITCPSSNMIGLYYLALPLLCHETGLTLQGARKALARVSKADLAHYDEASELVWVPNGAAYQIGDSLKAGDHRITGVMRELETFANHAYAQLFFDRYAAPYRLTRPEWLPSPSQGPSKPLASQDQDQDQDQEQAQEQEQEQKQATAPATPDAVRVVFDHWSAERRARNPKAREPILDDKRRKAIRARLAEKFTVEDLKLACTGVFMSDFHTGNNDRGKEYTDITIALKNARNVEEFRDLASGTTPDRGSGVMRLVPPPPEILDEPQEPLSPDERARRGAEVTELEEDIFRARIV